MIFHWGFGGEATKLSYRRLSKLKGFWSAGDKIFGILWTQYLSSQRPKRKVLCSSVSNTRAGLYR